ncbi:hypothetical protein H5410_021424 [Solanum commersonii]|uniref:Uncharacterized protein n=1 Tax=Solanum commersonii TaxID=4109 RepID=A0A9J5ZDZ2_SOLCO|nr:hypothetical protein H5410_021424 [Solanum commersonii]
MRSQHNLEEHDSFDGDNYGYGIDDQDQQERLGGRGRRRGNGGWHPIDGYGHKGNECPNRKNIIALNDGGYQIEDEFKDHIREDDSSDEFIGEGDEEEIDDDG